MVAMPEEREALVISAALKPETLRTARESEVMISVRDKTLLVDFRAETISGLRALVNGYIRWIAMIERTLEVVDNRKSAYAPYSKSST